MTTTFPIDDLGTSRHLLVSQRLRERRRSLGLTQRQVVGHLAGLGITTTDKALSSLEHGAGLDVAKLPELAAVLDCSVTWLLGLNDDPGQWDPDRDPRPRRPAPSMTRVVADAEPAGSQAAPAVPPQPVTPEPVTPEPVTPQPVTPQPWILGPMSAGG